MNQAPAKTVETWPTYSHTPPWEFVPKQFLQTGLANQRYLNDEVLAKQMACLELLGWFWSHRLTKKSKNSKEKILHQLFARPIPFSLLPPFKKASNTIISADLAEARHPTHQKIACKFSNKGLQ